MKFSMVLFYENGDDQTLYSHTWISIFCSFATEWSLKKKNKFNLKWNEPHLMLSNMFGDCTVHDHATNQFTVHSCFTYFFFLFSCIPNISMCIFSSSFLFNVLVIPVSGQTYYKKKARFIVFKKKSMLFLIIQQTQTRFTVFIIACVYFMF